VIYLYMEELSAAGRQVFARLRGASSEHAPEEGHV
jgi:hypothetical protein